MEVNSRPIEKVKPFTRNARKIPPEAVEKVATSIREFGWRQPIVVDRNGVIICGHLHCGHRNGSCPLSRCQRCR